MSSWPYLMCCRHCDALPAIQHLFCGSGSVQGSQQAQAQLKRAEGLLHLHCIGGSVCQLVPLVTMLAKLLQGPNTCITATC